MTSCCHRFRSIGAAIDRMAFEPSKRSGDYLLWADTGASLQRLALGVGISAAIALMFGILLGIIPYINAGFSPFVSAISMIPPMAILPILFIVFGLGEVSKVVLVVIGITPFIIRDLQQRVRELPSEQIIKAQTLGGSTWQLIIRVVSTAGITQTNRCSTLSLGAAWLFLIAAEAIAATEGLGYRIFLVRRYLAMDVILPYVIWITLLAFLTDLILRYISRLAFPWFQKQTADST